MSLGKIARLPHAIREELNTRLKNHELGQAILEWLNGLPEVHEILTTQFDGKPINKPNLTHWRQGGFREWQALHEALEHVPEALSEAAKIEASTGTPVSETISDWGAVHYLLAARAMLQTGNNSSNLKLLQRFCRDSVALQRRSYFSDRLNLDNERFEFLQKQMAADTVNQVVESLLSRRSPAPLNSPGDGELRLVKVN